MVLAGTDDLGVLKKRAITRAVELLEPLVRSLSAPFFPSDSYRSNGSISIDELEPLLGDI